MYTVTKTIPHSAGLSVCFRQWRATHSHCSRLHGYALEIETVFAANRLNPNSWVFDFGAYRPIREEIFRVFDHALVIAEDDPARATFEALAEQGLARVVVVPKVGCEAFAELIFRQTEKMLAEDARTVATGVHVRSVTVREHGANAATFERPA